MSKETKKNKRFTYNQEIIKTLSSKHGLTTYFIRQCLSGHRDSITADTVKADYKKLEAELNKTIENFKHNTKI